MGTFDETNKGKKGTGNGRPGTSGFFVVVISLVIK